MNGSGPERPRGAGSGPPQGVIAAVVVLVALVVIGFAVVIGVRLGGNYLGERTATGPVATSTTSTSRTPPRPRTSSTTTEATTTRRATAVCDARAINRDLGYPDSGARIIDCGGGWAVMASEYSGDPFWVSFQGGRWQAERGVSMYLFTCPDQAIARGAPAWMADKHLNTCRSLTSSTSTTRSSSTRPSATNPGVSPSARPSPSASPSPSTSASSSTSVSPTVTSEETTTTTPPADPTPAGPGEFD